MSGNRRHGRYKARGKAISKQLKQQGRDPSGKKVFQGGQAPDAWVFDQEEVLKAKMAELEAKKSE